jgi:GNAT superfamily N-acetyltransferase
LRIRPARPDEGERLREIAIAAKSHWGYERGRVLSWAADGDFTAAGLEAKHAFVAEVDGRVVAWAGLIPQGETCWLDDLWVEPDAMRRGVGGALFRSAAEQAAELGCTRMEWEAEPNALGFYEKMGGRFVRDGEPSAWGRVNQVLGMEL